MSVGCNQLKIQIGREKELNRIATAYSMKIVELYGLGNFLALFHAFMEEILGIIFVHEVAMGHKSAQMLKGISFFSFLIANSKAY